MFFDTFFKLQPKHKKQINFPRKKYKDVWHWSYRSLSPENSIIIFYSFEKKKKEGWNKN